MRYNSKIVHINSFLTFYVADVVSKQRRSDETPHSIDIFGVSSHAIQNAWLATTMDMLRKVKCIGVHQSANDL